MDSTSSTVIANIMLDAGLPMTRDLLPHVQRAVQVEKDRIDEWRSPLKRREALDGLLSRLIQRIEESG